MGLMVDALVGRAGAQGDLGTLENWANRRNVKFNRGESKALAPGVD